jgi:hypothetical protein
VRLMTLPVTAERVFAGLEESVEDA